MELTKETVASDADESFMNAFVAVRTYPNQVLHRVICSSPFMMQNKDFGKRGVPAEGTRGRSRWFSPLDRFPLRPDTVTRDATEPSATETAPRQDEIFSTLLALALHTVSSRPRQETGHRTELSLSPLAHLFVEVRGRPVNRFTALRARRIGARAPASGRAALPGTKAGVFPGLAWGEQSKTVPANSQFYFHLLYYINRAEEVKEKCARK